MGVGVSIFTITLGAILKFAIAQDAMKDPVDVHTIGVILMIVGGASFALQLLLGTRAQQRQPGLGNNHTREHTYNDDKPSEP